MDLKPTHRYLVSEARFRERTRCLVREFHEQERRRFAEILAADPLPPLEDVPIGAAIRFAEKETSRGK
jgi:hypothetical protein